VERISDGETLIGLVDELDGTLYFLLNVLLLFILFLGIFEVFLYFILQRVVGVRVKVFFDEDVSLEIDILLQLGIHNGDSLLVHLEPYLPCVWVDQLLINFIVFRQGHDPYFVDWESQVLGHSDLVASVNLEGKVFEMRLKLKGFT